MNDSNTTPVSMLKTVSVTPGSSFAVLGLSVPLIRALLSEGYDQPTPVQRASIPHVLDGRDLLSSAQTGTGKTAAFLLPMLQRLAAGERGKLRALVIAPTRELAAQIAERASAYGRNLPVRHTTVYGGVSQRSQVQALRQGVDLLIATPGRLLDLMNQGAIRLDRIETFVLDEADRMLDMGFVPDVRRILAAMPKVRQTLLFSATMPGEIDRLAREILKDPIRVAMTPRAGVAESISHSAYHVSHTAKRALLEHLLRGDAGDRVIVFTRTKHGANRLCQQLSRSGFNSSVIHGNKSQSQRERALDQFRAGKVNVLVATDVAARGIDVDNVRMVVNFDIPNVAESYVHRIGRTGRAGNHGTAVSFCDPSERPLLGAIERLLRVRISVSSAPVIEASAPLPATLDQERSVIPPPNPRAVQGKCVQSQATQSQRPEPARSRAKHIRGRPFDVGARRNSSANTKSDHNGSRSSSPRRWNSQTN